MAKLPTHRQARENRAFLDHLRRHGNAQAAARDVGVSITAFKRRRRLDAPFAAEWEAALAQAQAALQAHGRGWREDLRAQLGADGRMQLRRPRKGSMGRDKEQAFLRALAATCNVTMSAAAAGVGKVTVYKRRRDKAFATEWDLALKIGHERLHMIQLERFDQALGNGGADRAWTEHDDTPPPMTTAEALHLLSMHRREVVLGSEHRAEHRIAKRIGRRGVMSIDEIGLIRRAAHDRENAERAQEERIRARLAKRAEHYEATGNWFLPGEAGEGAAPDWAAAEKAAGRKGKGVRMFTREDAAKVQRLNAERRGKG